MGRLICTWMDWEDDRAEGSCAPLVLLDEMEKQYPYLYPDEYYYIGELFDNPEEEDYVAFQEKDN
jgi:hypothetical protein